MSNPITYDQARNAMYRIYREELVNPCVEAIKEAVASGEDENDAMHEAVDNALIYYKDQYMTLFCSDHDDQYFEQMGGKSVEGDCDTKIISQLAYFNLMADVLEAYESEAA